jgi:hypothetical protein
MPILRAKMTMAFQVEKIASDGTLMIMPRHDGFFSFSAGGRIVVTYCGFVCATCSSSSAALRSIQYPLGIITSYASRHFDSLLLQV